uniref:Uncharacterized protein n=1 Tax=viral metagenome TaxID=1070528 RepID=A0A6H2A195_9ZZZZ
MTYSAKYTDATSIYTKTGLTASQVDLTTNDSQIISEAEAELEMLVGRKFTGAIAVTEYFSPKGKDVIGNFSTSIQLKNFPIQSITSFTTVDIDGDAVDTYDTLSAAEITAGTFESEDYWMEAFEDPLTNLPAPTGKVTLKEDSFPEGTNSIKVSYTYGYSSVPAVVKELATCLAGIRQWVTFMGGQYNRVNSYNLPEKSFNKGDFYQRAKQNIEMLREEADRLIDMIGRKSRVLAFSTGSVR